MDVEQIKEVTRGVPHTPPEMGEKLYNFILENEFSSCLELGFAHGVGSLWIAGALDKLGQNGRLTSVDNMSAHDRDPNIFALLEKANLQEYVKPVFNPLGYNWFLMEHMEQGGETFDFCFIDGSHTWDVDGYAFLLVERLLRPGGVVLFDDLDWSYATSHALKNSEQVARMDPKRRDTAQIRKVFELLAKANAGYECWEADGWGYARKLG